MIISLLILLSIAIILKLIFELGNIYINISIYIRNIKFKVKSKYLDLDNLNRDIDVSYSPALLSYLMNYKLEPTKDILATILNLYNKNIIEIRHTNDKYEFIEKINIDLKEMTEDEKYIYYTLVKKEKRNFSLDIWKKIVIDEYNKFFKKSPINKVNSAEKIIKTSMLLTVLVTILIRLIMDLTGNITDFDGNIFANIGIFIIQCIIIYLPVSLFVLIYSECILPIFHLLKRKLNEKEEKELIKWMKFENFIKEYTLLSDRKLEDVILYEKYITYAMVLNINKEYKNNDIKHLVEYYMKNIKPNIQKHIDFKLNSKEKQKYTFK